MTRQDTTFLGSGGGDSAGAAVEDERVVGGENAYDNDLCPSRSHACPADVAETAGQPDSRTAGQPDSRTAGQPDNRTTGQPDSRTAGQPDSRTTG